MLTKVSFASRALTADAMSGIPGHHFLLLVAEGRVEFGTAPPPSSIFLALVPCARPVRDDDGLRIGRFALQLVTARVMVQHPLVRGPIFSGVDRHAGLRPPLHPLV